ncbi:MAG TPA: class I SAM-dependent methyltransferase [Steroidobacteraceae bacterium]
MRKRELLTGVALVTVAASAAALRRSREPAIATNETERVRDLYDREAVRYDSIVRIPERLFFIDGRVWATAQAAGNVLEIAIGTARNLPHYRSEVRLTGVDISPAMLAIAQERAQALGREIDLRVGDAQDLEFPTERFDSVVGTLALCTIPDDRRALAEAWRVLRPGGRLVLLEHVRSPQTVVRLLQKVLEPLAIRYAGDHLLRDPLDHLANLGFSIEYCARSRAGIVERVVARKPTTDDV